jgi:hypothetical protein
MSPSSPSEALYYSIPQEPVDESHAGYDNEERESELALNSDLPQTSVNPNISWIYFLLGSSVLLPWNGMFSLGSIPAQWVDKFISYDHGHPLLPFPTCRFPTQTHIHFLPNHFFHYLQFCLLGPRNHGI